MYNLKITDEDIKYAERVLKLPKGFDTPRINVIKCNESRDIIACPGSGKTTVLLAKLLILHRNLPLEKNKGICVLTHTNVAIDEIKERLGSDSGELLNYPNFVGTIHSFINKFLANPASVKYFSSRVTRVFEAEDYKSRLVRKYRSLFPPFSGSKLDGFLYGRLEKEIKESKDNSIKTQAKEDLLRSLEFDYTDYTIKRVAFNKRTTVLKNPDSDAYKEYIKLIEELQGEGVYSYNELQGLALKYVKEFERELQSIFSERFSVVYIDEMQDTSSLQLQILEKIFDKGKVVFQCFGDPQQTIYESDDKGCAWEAKNPLIIKNSNRLSKSIAKVADVVSLKPYGMQGRESSKDYVIPPVIITYKENNVSHVLETFSKLIIKNQLHKSENAVFKAVGMVKTKNDGLSITSYFPEFEKNEIKKSANKDFPRLQNYTVKLDREVIEKEGIKAYYNRFVLAILKYLRMNDIRNADGKFFSNISFLKYMRETDDRLYKTMHRYFARIILAIEKNKVVIASFRYVMAIILKRLFHIEVDLLRDEFFNSVPFQDIKAVNFRGGNIYHYGNDLKIEVSSVHSVKGQTHNATLYLETFYFSKTNESIINYLIGNKNTVVEDYIGKHIRVAYVAMTRPTDLLCIVLNEKVYLENEAQLRSLGWIHHSDALG